jgi:hypothetical protein
MAEGLKYPYKSYWGPHWRVGQVTSAVTMA